MKYVLRILLFIWLMELITQTAVGEKSLYDFDIKINHLVREQFFSASIVYPVYKNLIIGADYGYLYYHQAGLNVGYRFNMDNIIPYIITGVFYTRENFTKSTYYREYFLKLGGGIESELSHNFFMNIETTVLNYLSINYSMRKIKYRETYDFGESFDYSVSIGIGYRFHF